ncbi:hypothetical protein GCM10025866_32500 [Naasia aerilata]|uniref:PHP domain-containing protein n=1 Tax=Naasia aerilata TaxID=1162966 RepID=A0ABN6XUL4_9MICO|nr:hypothetical protein GCM10025866_32500 [Naasia aerilata]
MRWGNGGEDDVSGAGAYTHMTLLSSTTEGMHNLFRLSSKASIEGQYFKPRMDRELLSTYGKGLIATTGCPSGEVQTRLRLGQYEEARQAAADYRDIFGAENFYAEIMDHGLGIERRVMGDVIRLAKDLGLPLVATNDLHYTHAHDATSHAALLCVQSGSTLDDPNRFKFDADEFYLKSAAQMRQLFSDHPEACDNTLLIAERCDVKFDESANYMPRFPVPEGRPRRPGWSRRSRPDCATATRTASRPRCRSAPTTRSASSSRWASPATSSSSPTSSTGARTTASAWGPGADPAPARWSPMR